MGEHTAVGQTAECSILTSCIDEASEPQALALLADAVDDAVRSWSPSGWDVRETTLVEERGESHEAEGRTYQSFILRHLVIVERA